MLLAGIKVTEEMGPENSPPLWPRAGCPPTTGAQTVMSGGVWASPAVPPEKGELPPPVLPPQGMAVGTGAAGSEAHLALAAPLGLLILCRDSFLPASGFQD